MPPTATAPLLDDDEIIHRILSFAAFLSGPDPEAAARRRAWMDDAGRPTRDGLELVRAILDQRGTRSSIRNF